MILLHNKEYILVFIKFVGNNNNVLNILLILPIPIMVTG